ncbi:MAG: leucine-rich repeat domain-containing protein [Planctomycetaceae bacterium]
MQPRRRWFQFSLRSLLVLLLVASAGLGYFAYLRRESRLQWEAVRAIEKTGGRFGSVVNGVPTIGAKLEEAPEWQRSLGIDWPEYTVVAFQVDPASGRTIPPAFMRLRKLEEIILWGVGIDDEDLKGLSALPNLQSLSVDGDRVTDTGVACFAGNKKLQEVRFRGKQITDRGLAIVAKLPQLRSLKWISERTTDEGLKHLRGNTRLTSVWLNGATATDRGLEHLSHCENLEEVFIDEPNTITSRGIGSLASLEKLKCLWFTRSPLSADGLSALSSLTTLETLCLTGPVAQEDLAYVSPLTSLRNLTLFNSELSGEGLRNLSTLKQLEDLKVSLSGLQDEDMELVSSFANLRKVDLRESKVTDDGLMKLAGMKRLFYIDVAGSQVTEVGVSEFEQVAPNVMLFGP